MRSLIVVLAGTSNVVPASILIDIHFITPYLKLLPKRIKIHQIGVEEILFYLLGRFHERVT